MKMTPHCNLPLLILSGILAFQAASQGSSPTNPITPAESSSATTGNGTGGTNSAPGGKNLDQETRDLKAHDGLSFTILEDPNRSNGGKIEINELGDAKFPITATGSEYINIKAAGRRLADVRREIKQRLEEEYYHVATVSVDVWGIGTTASASQSANTAKVIVYGKSINQTIPLKENEKLTLSEAFARIGHLEFAKLSKVEVFRWDPKAQKLLPAITKNVKKMLDSGDLSEDIELSDGDRIKVLDRGINF